MEKIRLKELPSSFKFLLTSYFLLVSIGFVCAALMSHDRYDFDHQKTIQYYLGDPAEGEAAFKKPFSHLLGVTHIHSFTLPLIFLSLWIALEGTLLKSRYKKTIIIGGSVSILIYNTSPYLVRFVSPHYVSAFTIGGVGLFLFFFLGIGIVFTDLWRTSENYSDK